MYLCANSSRSSSSSSPPQAAATTHVVSTHPQGIQSIGLPTSYTPVSPSVSETKRDGAMVVYPVGTGSSPDLQASAPTHAQAHYAPGDTPPALLPASAAAYNAVPSSPGRTFSSPGRSSRSRSSNSASSTPVTSSHRYQPKAGNSGEISERSGFS